MLRGGWQGVRFGRRGITRCWNSGWGDGRGGRGGLLRCGETDVIVASRLPGCLESALGSQWEGWRGFCGSTRFLRLTSSWRLSVLPHPPATLFSGPPLHLCRLSIEACHPPMFIQLCFASVVSLCPSGAVSSDNRCEQVADSEKDLRRLSVQLRVPLVLTSAFL